MAVSVAVAVASALAAAPLALAHARPLDSTPANGAVLAQAPHVVTLRFDDVVVVAPGAAAIRNGGDGASLLAGAEQARGSIVTLPLRAGLGDGDYSVRWRVLGDDGHLLEGVLAFAVGEGRSTPSPGLALLGSGPRWAFVLARWLFLAGLLAALGGLGFRAVVLGGRRHPLDGRLLLTVSAAFAVALAGAGLSVVAVPDSLHTRFGQAAVAGIAAAALGVVLAEVGRTLGRFALASLPAALALAAVAAASGHALDPPAGLRPVKVAVDLVHLGAAALWIGGLLQVVVLVPRLAAAERATALRRFAWVAGGSLALVAATGVGRAAFGLSAVHQAWDTGYGRALVVKAALLAVALGVALVARRAAESQARAAASPRPSRALLLELALVAGIVVAVALLADLRPGR